jgi:hypothetical protein
VAAAPPDAAGAGLRVQLSPLVPPLPPAGSVVPVSRAQPTSTSALVSTAAASTNPRLIRMDYKLLFRPARLTTGTTTGNVTDVPASSHDRPTGVTESSASLSDRDIT